MSATDSGEGPLQREAVAGRAGPSMRTPAFFEEVPPIVLRDALAETLGAATDGVMEYRYLDAVKLAGHSCPTVAGAWLMTRAALARLYPGEMPRRGELRVELREAQEAGVAGVIASVAGLITGAAGPGGFHGLGGQHVRRGLLEFGKTMRGQLRITRLDTGRSVEVSHHPEVVARPPALGTLLQAALGPGANDSARQAFATVWQAWVRTILIEHADNPGLITMED
jgi:hypothetical protein